MYIYIYANIGIHVHQASGHPRRRCRGELMDMNLQQGDEIAGDVAAGDAGRLV